jgi:ribosomal protein L2
VSTETKEEDHLSEVIEFHVGIAMNPRDHPHGGGSKGRQAKSPWGWLTKGPKTGRKKWYVIKERWRQ